MMLWLFAANVGVLMLLLLLLAEDAPAAAAATSHASADAEPALALSTLAKQLQPLQPMPPGQLAYLRLPGSDLGMREWMHCGCGQLRQKKRLGCTFAHTANGTDIQGKGATLIATHGAFAPLHRAAANGLFSVGVFVTVVKEPIQRLWDLYRTAHELRGSVGWQDHKDDAWRCLSLLPLERAVKALDCAAVGVDPKEACLATVCPTCPLSCLDQVSNALVRQLGAAEGAGAGVDADVAMFQRAQRRLRFNFRVVGLTERPEDTYRLLQAAFPWLVSPACTLRDAAGPAVKDRPPPQLLEALQKHNAMDQQLFASARAHFEKALVRLDRPASADASDAGGDRASSPSHASAYNLKHSKDAESEAADSAKVSSTSSTSSKPKRKKKKAAAAHKTDAVNDDAESSAA